MNLYERKYFFETDGKHFLFPFVASAYDTLRGRGYICHLFSDFDKSNLEKYENGDVIFGSIESCKYGFVKSGIEIPKYLGYPDEVSPFYGRKIVEMDYSEVMNQELPIFVKPKDDVKRFTGDVFREDQWRTITLNGHQDTMFYVSEVVDFVSEWRVFVHNREVYACQNYSGNPLSFPSPDVINSIVNLYDNCPIAYTIDVGITSYGETLIVEINDMWATGSYGAYDYEYTMAYIDRWLEIINKKT